MNILSDSQRISLLAIPSHQLGRDRASKAPKIDRFYRLIFSILAIVFLHNICKSQITNQLAFERELCRVIETRGLPVDSIAGFGYDSLWSRIHQTPGVKRYLSIEDPAVEFKKLQSGDFGRRITTVVSFVDSTEMALPIDFQDTVAAKDFRMVRRSAPVALRGTDPRWTIKYLLPAGLIGTGIAGIISLFYLRS